MKINAIKFFRTNKPEPLPQPIITKSGDRKRFEMVRKGKKIDLFM